MSLSKQRFKVDNFEQFLIDFELFYNRKLKSMDYSLVTTYKTDGVCYLILPEGVSKDLSADLQELAECFSLSFVMVGGVDWNDDLTPWPALGVFKKAKPFGGQASAFLTKLCNEIVPKAEGELGLSV